MKRLTAVFAAIILTALSLTACSGSDSDVYTNSGGESYEVVRDEQGNIVINDSGKLLVYTLNENGKKQKSDSGEYITQYIDFNGQVVTGSRVETAEMRFTLPPDFVEDYDNPGFFKCDGKSGEIFVSYYNKDMSQAVETTEYNSEALLESYGSEDFSYEKYELECSSQKVTAIKQVCTSPEYYRTVYFYYFEYDTGYYRIDCSVDTAYGDSVDFDSIITGMTLKGV